MEFIAGYGDDEESPRQQPQVQQPSTQIANAAPEVDTTGLVLIDNKALPMGDALHLQPAAARSIKYNLPADQMHAPALGPANPADNGNIPAGMRNHWAGHAEDAHLDSFTFDEQYHTFHSYGRAANPAGTGVVVNPHRTDAEQHIESGTIFSNAAKRQKTEKKKKDTTTPAFDPSVPFTLKTRQPWAEKEVDMPELTEEQQAYLAQLKESKAEKQATEGKSEHTVFHGAAEKDYQGRSWLEPPNDKRKEGDQCFLPKRLVHTWSGHTKGVNAIRFFPNTGHMLLSAGLDGKIKIWDVHGNKQCMRTYMGHSKGVRDIWFTEDGRRFVSTAYDKTIKVWDTETGTVLGKYGDGQMAYTVRFHPDADKNKSVLIAGMQNKKILQFDLDSGEVVQEYDYHLGAVNSITFIDQNRRFVSTSDDKTIRVWEFGIPVQVKYIADPSMHAISAVGLSHNGKWFCGQSMDNQVLTFSADDKVKANRKKTFKGHSVAGYACQVNFSHDDRYVLSGDGDGKLFIWDWKTTKIARSLKAHEGVCIGCEWNPIETSKVATCGWDGLIKYWD